MIKDMRSATLKRCGENPLYKAIIILEAAWALLLAIGFFATDLGKPSFAWAFALVLRLVIIAGIAVSHGYYLVELDPGRYRGYKAFVGYAAFFTYVASAIFSSANFEEGASGKGAAWFGWAVALLQTAPALALYFMIRMNEVRAALGVLSAKDLKAKTGWKPPKAKTLAGKILDNVDAVLQAVILVAVIHSTLFQLYVIPTESMVPKFLIGDRVIVTKLQSGPRVPLSPLKTPSLYHPKRGDIIVYDNPFSPRPPVLKRMLNTMVFYLTLSTVNLDKDESGGARVGTVVKRLVGMPGEKLLMVDDVLYSRKEGDSDWTRLETDAAWARTDLWKEAAQVRSKIKDLTISEGGRQELESTDDWKNNSSIRELSAKADSLAVDFASISPERLRASLVKPSADYFDAVERKSFARIAAAEEKGDGGYYARNALMVEGDSLMRMPPDVQNFLYAVSNRERLGRFVEFLRPATYPESLDPYESSSAKLNLLVKISMAERWMAYLGMLKAGDSSGLSMIAVSSEKVSELDVMGLSDEATEIAGAGEAFKNWIILIRYFSYYDRRNFAEFPRGGEYLAEGKYFLMGDNRYNSLDFRYLHESGARRFIPLDANDPESVSWFSSLEPSSLDGERILGKVLFTFWPPSSIGR